ncbi:MAG: CHAD domain-containing protein [Methanoregulaceae archaeon]|nr:CHAD domain-containing protein [Methanoregulaceae archaeon]
MGSGSSPKLVATTPIDEAARLLIGRPVQRLLQHYVRAAEMPYADPEDIHQLRVFSRRAGAAVKAFSFLTASGNRRPLVRALKDIRGVAGQARDCDVLIESLKSWRESAAPEAQPSVAFLIGFAQGERTAAQGALERVFEEMSPKELRRRWKRVSKDLHAKDNAQTLGDQIGPVVQPQIARVLEALARPNPTIEQLHAVRIEGKRARYTLELFAGCIDKQTARCGLEALTELQETLGSLNDSAVTLARLEKLHQRIEASDPLLWESLKPGFELLAASHRENQVARMEDYRSHREVLRDRLAPLGD